MRNLVVFMLFFVLNLTHANEFKICGASGLKEFRKQNCRSLNPHFNIPNYELVTVNELGNFIEDLKTKFVWSPELSSKIKKCTRPYKKAKRIDYRKSSGLYQFDKSKLHCVSDLDNFLLLKPNRYLIFQK